MHSKKDSKYQEFMQKFQATQEQLQQHVISIKKNEKWLVALNTISGFLIQSPEMRHALMRTAEIAIEIVGVDAVLIHLLDKGTQDLLLEVSKGVSEESVVGVNRVHLGSSFTRTLAKTGKPVIMDYPTATSRRNGQVMVIEGIRSQLVVPLRSKSGLVGTISMVSYTPRKFYADEVMLLSSIGNLLGIGVENSRVSHNSNQVTAQLLQSEERYRNLFENADDAIWVHDLEGITLDANNAYEKLTHFSSEELRNVSICRQMSDGSRSNIERIEQKLLKNELVDHRCEGELIKEGGEKMAVQVTTSIIKKEDKVIGFQHSARDVTEERQLQENLRYYLQQVTRAQEEERKRIARELHDETLQSLVTISRQLDKITSSDALWEESLEVVRSFKKRVEVAVQEIRRFSHDLRPSVLDDLGLLSALELLADDLEKERIVTKFKVVGDVVRLVPEVEVTLFRIAQEAVSNIRRHAQASATEIVIEFCDTKVKLSIRDNGKGHSFTKRPRDIPRLGKFGLVGMYERARLLGGSLIVDSKLGKGTVITVEAPI